MTRRLAACALLLTACGNADPRPPFDVRISARQYNELAVKFSDGQVSDVDCRTLCVSTTVFFSFGTCHLATSNEGLPLVRCVPSPLPGE